ncbi:MAG TPA: ABC transporter permease [Acidobacteriaceae bacterium]|nr:ABC transporter permease [Acidobacteriaceae bacterium]
MNDIRYAVRIMRKAPLFTTAVVLTSALGIGAGITIFSIVNALLIRPLPFKDPGSLVQVAEKNDKLQLASFGASVLNFLDWREQNHSFDQMGAIGFATYTLTGTGEPEQITGNLISPTLTRVLGLQPIAGRAFSDSEEKPGSSHVAMLGEGLWKRRFGADPSIIGRTITLNGQGTTVVGIAPASLALIGGGDIYTPLVIDPASEIRLNHVIVCFARLKPGVSIAQAQSEMNSISIHNGQVHPEIRDWGIRLINLRDTFVSTQLKTGLVVLLCAVLLVLLIACANIANLLLARAAARRNEIAMRTAIGATPVRLIRQLLVESIALSCCGGAIGLGAATGALRVMNHLLPANTLPLPAIAMDSNVAWFAVGITLLTGLLFGLAPALRCARGDLSHVLRQSGRGIAGSGGLRLRNGLASLELALATILLIAAGLLLRTLANLEQVQLGFRPHGLLTFQLSPPVAKYPLTGGGAARLYRVLIDDLDAIPGVRSAVSSGIPFGAGNYTTHPMFTTGASALPPSALVPIDWRIVSPGYFASMGIPLLRGRDFTDADNSTSAGVLIVSQSTATKFWGEADPLGRTLHPSAAPDRAFTVIGVVGDVHDTALNQQNPQLYYPMSARVAGLMDVVVRTASSPDSVLPAVRQKIREIDPQLALANVRTEDEWVSNGASQPRLNSVLLGIFAAIALAIASIGVYGVLAYSASQRTGEIGVRMAVGATRTHVLRLIVSEGIVISATGIAVGLIGALAVGRLLSSLVFGIDVHDPLTFTISAAALALVALAASVVPALRAARVDPIVALRHE